VRVGAERVVAATACFARRRWKAAAALLVCCLGTTLGAATCNRNSTRRTPLVRMGNGAFVLPDRAQCDDELAEAVDVAALDLERAPALREVSGVASSYANQNLLWMLADSDNPAVVYGVADIDGRIVVEVRLPVENQDWEDLALGPCPDLSGPCIFVADTGNNDGNRDVLFVYAFPEPELSQASQGSAPLNPDDNRGVASVLLDAVWTMPLALPDDGKEVDLEAMAVLPDATAILFFEKTKADEARIFAYRAPWTTSQPDEPASFSPRVLEETGRVVVAWPPTDGGEGGALATVSEVSALDADQDDKKKKRSQRITGAALHWSGRRLALRTLSQVIEFVADDASVFLDLSRQTPRNAVPSPAGEDQGEAITYDADGTSLWTVSEVKRGDVPWLHRLGCAGAVLAPLSPTHP
jgi:hypothetical protein